MWFHFDVFLSLSDADRYAPSTLPFTSVKKMRLRENVWNKLERPSLISTRNFVRWSKNTTRRRMQRMLSKI